MKAHTVIMLTLCGLLLACSNSELRDDETETFQPRILADGSKMFDYRLDTPSSQPQKPKLVFDANETRDMNSPPEMAPYSAEKEKAHIETRVLNLIDEKIRVTGYCRQGYVVVRQQIGFSQSLVTGECKESATDEDHRAFIRQ